MFSVFRAGMPTELLPEFLLHAIHEHGKLTISQIQSIVPQVERAWLIAVIGDMREHGLIDRDGSSLTLTNDGRGLREAQHVPQWYYDTDHDHLWHPAWEHLDGVNLVEKISPYELKIIHAFKRPFRTSEASEVIQFSSYQILCGLEQGGYLRRT
jgi:hypothetical protein